MRPTSRTMTLRIAIALAALGACGLWGCGLFDSVQATKVMAASILATPEYDMAKLASGFDAGIAYDGGMTLPDGGSGTVPSQTVAEVFFGERNASDPSKAPSGIAGATVKLSIGSKTLQLADKGNGNYSLTSIENSQLAYVSGVDYDITVTYGGANYTATVKGPAEEKIEQFHTGSATLEVTANSPLQLTRTSTDNVAFTSVFPTDQQQGQTTQPTWTNVPTKPIDLFDLVANDAKWRMKVITVDGSAFPKPQGYYVVSVAAVSRGHTSDNLFTTSIFLAGTADLGLVKTK